jgi:hypothetical protein
MKPLRLGLHYSPPTIIVEYLDESAGKRYHRRIGLPFLKVTDDPIALSARLKVKFQAYLGDVSTKQLERLIRRMQDNCDDALLGQSTPNQSPLISGAFMKSSPETVTSQDFDVHFGLGFGKVVNFDRKSFKPSDWGEDIQL